MIRSLDARATGAADRLRALGPEGTRVALLAETSPETVTLVQASLRAGVVLCPLSTRLPEAAVAEALERLRCRVLVTDREGRAPPGVRVLAPGDVGARSDPRWAGMDARVALDRPALAVLTSGTTGTPKIALFTSGALLASARGVNGALDLRASDRWLLDLPLHHVGGLGVVFRCAVAGAALVLPPRGTSTAEALRQSGATHVSLVATQLRRLLGDAAEGETFDGLRCVLLGASAIPAGLLDEAAARGLPVATSYGLTEMGSTVTMTRPGAPRAALATSGRALAHVRLEVRDAEIHVGGPSLFSGYLDGDGLAEPFAADGLFATGDLGHLDAEGRLVVTGRRDHLFVSGGENVQPEEVEAALAALPGVLRAVVVAVPDAEWGHRGVAFVERAGGGPPDGAALAAGLRQSLAGFKVPAAFYAWPPSEEGMKPDRRALAALAEEMGNRRED